MASSSSLPSSRDESSFNDIVNLNVGGRHFSTTRGTLCRDPDSMLAAMFGGNFLPGCRDMDGRVFIDRDGDVFCHVINYLRSMRLQVPENFADRARLLAEAEYFGLRHLQELLTGHRCSQPQSASIVKRFAELWLMESASSGIEQFYHPHYAKTKTVARISGPEAVIRRLELDCICGDQSLTTTERALMDRCRVMRLELADSHDKLNYLAEMTRIGGQIVSHSSSMLNCPTGGHRSFERYLIEFSFVDTGEQLKENCLGSRPAVCECLSERLPLRTVVTEKTVPIIID